MNVFGIDLDMAGLVALFMIAITAIAALQGVVFDRFNISFDFGQNGDWGDCGDDGD